MHDTKARWLIGIDEAGRGPLAGPVTVGAVALRYPLEAQLPSQHPYDLGVELPRDLGVVAPLRVWENLLPGCRIADSKRMSVREREKTFTALCHHSHCKTRLCDDLPAFSCERSAAESRFELRFRVSMVSARVIDRIDISAAVRMGVARALARLALDPEQCEVLLDGLLRAPREYRHQRTIVRGDASEPIISLASIAAKVTRDRHMVRLAKKFPQYRFESHKGYGTVAHYESLRAHGPSKHHRRTFLTKLLQ